MDFGTDDAARGGGDDMGEWEWPRTHCEELREIESLLRCQICGDFLHGPVLLPCSHAFCSECVRKFLQSRGAHAGCCPECKQQCAPSDLIANRSMEKVALLFRQLKPKLLHVLDASRSSSSRSTVAAATSSPVVSANSSARRPSNGKARAVERLPVVSYNVMKDKEVRKLLESIGIRLPVKNRNEIIQIHKEFVLLNNAQIDSCNPKSVARLRDEVIRNHKLRVADKQQQQADAARKHTGGTPTAVTLTAQMKANFERLKHEIAERKANPQRAAAIAEPPADSVLHGVPPEAIDAPTLGLSAAPVGVWRHVYSHSHRCELYVNSVTREIRLEQPREFAQQQNPKNRYDDDFDDAGDSNRASTLATAAGGDDAANCSVDLTAEDGESATSDIVEPTKAATDRTTSSGATKGKRPAGFLSPELSAATQDFSFSSDDDADNQTAAARRRSSTVSVAAATTVLTPSKALGTTTVAAAAVTSDAKWDCPRCTLVNDPSATQCEACGYETKPTAAAGASAGTSASGSARKRQKKMHFQSKISLG